MKELQAQIDELEKSATELKRKTNAVSTLMNEFSNLRAVQEQMVNEKNKTFDDLKEEFEGMGPYSLFSLTNRASYRVR